MMGSPETNTPMNRKLSTIVLLILLAPFSPNRVEAESSSARPSGVGKNAAAVIPQAVPVVALLRSVEESDEVLFAHYRLGFDNGFGEHALDEFSFRFVGTADAGAATITIHKGDLPSLKVAKSGKSWKLGKR
jgi:hypothetical protein